MAITIADLQILVTANTEPATAGLKTLNAQVAQVSKTGIAASIGLIALGESITQIGQAGAHFAEGFISQAIDFNHMMMELQNNNASTIEQLGEMKTGILELAQMGSATLPDLALGMRNIRDYGFSAADSLQILTLSMKAASSTGEDTAATAQLVATMLHQYGLEAKDAAVLVDTMLLTAQKTNVSFEQFAENARIATTVGAAFQVPYQQISAALGALERNGFGAAQAQTQVKNELTHIVHPAKAASDELERLTKLTGIDLVTDFSAVGLATKGLTGIFEDLRETYKRLGYSQAGASQETMILLNAQRGGIGTMVTTGTAWNDYITLLNSYGDIVSGKITPTETAYQLALQDTGYQISILVNQFNVLMITLGNLFKPIIDSVIKSLQDLIKQFMALPDSTKQFLATALMIGAAFAAIMGPILMFVALFPLFQAGFIMLAGPMGIVLLAATALSAAFISTVASILAGTNDLNGLAPIWENIKEPIMEFASWLQDKLPAAVKIASDVWQSVFIPIIGAIANFIVGTVIPAFQLLVEWLLTWLPVAIEAARSIIEKNLVPALQTIGEVILKHIIPTVLAFGNLVLTVVIPVVSAWADAFLKIVDFIAPVVSAIADFLLPIIQTLIQYVQQNLPTVVGAFSALAIILAGPLISHLVILAGIGLDLIAGWGPTLALFAAILLVFQMFPDAVVPMVEILGGMIITYRALVPILEAVNVYLEARAAKAAAVAAAQVVEAASTEALAAAETSLAGAQAAVGATSASAAGGITAVGAAAGIAIVPISLIAAAIVGVYAAIFLFHDQIADAAKNIFNGLKEGATNFVEGLQDFAVRGKDAITNFVQGIGDTITGGKESFFTAGQTAGTAMGAGTVESINAFRPNIATATMAIANDTSLTFGPQMAETGKEVGFQLTSSLADQIKDGQTSVSNATYDLGEVLKEPYTYAPGIGHNIGTFYVSGIAEAMANNINLVNTQITGLDHNLRVLQNPSYFYGANIGHNWIDGICNEVAAGIPVLNAQIASIKTALATMTQIAQTGSAPGYGFGESVPIYPPGFIGPKLPEGIVRTPAQTAADYAAHMTEWLKQQQADAEKMLKQFQDAAGGTLPGGKTYGQGLDLWTPGETGFTGSQAPPIGGDKSKGGGAGGSKKSAIQEAADQAKAIADAMKAVMDFAGQIMGFSMPTGIQDKIAQLASLANMMMMGMQAVALQFSDENLAKISAFSDATNKVFTAFNTAFDFFTKIADTGNHVLNGTTAIAAVSMQLAQKVQIIMNTFGPMTEGWNTFATMQVSEFADAANKVFTAFTTAFDFFTKIAETGNQVLNGTTQLVTVTNQLSEKIVIVMNVLGAMIPLWDTFSTKKISDFADATGKVFTALTIAFDLFTKMADAGDKVLNDTERLASTALQLAGDIVAIMNALQAVIPNWDVVADKQISDFAEATGKVATSLTSVFDFFNKIAASNVDIAGAADKVTELVNGVLQMMNSFGPISQGWDQYEKRVIDFANTVGPVADGLGKALTLFSNLAISKVSFKDLADRVTELSAAILQMMNTFGPMSEGWDQFEEQVVNFSNSADTVADGLGKGLTFFTALAGAKKVDFKNLADRVTELGFAVLQMMNSFGPLSEGWAPFEKQVSDFADTVGKVADGLTKAVTLFTGLASETFKVPDQTVFTNFFIGLNSIITEFGNRSKAWALVADEKTAQLATYIGSILDGISKAVGLLNALAVEDWKTPTQVAIDAFFGSLDAILRGFEAHAKEFERYANEVTTPIATAIGVVMDGIGKGIAPLVALADYKGITVAVIDIFFSNLDTFLQRFNEKAADWKNRSFDKVAKIAESIGTIADALGKVVDPLLKIMGWVTPEGKSTDKPSLGGERTKEGFNIKLVQATTGIDGFFNALSAFLDAFAARANAFKNQATKDVQAAATAIGNVMGDLGKVVDPLLKIAEFKGLDTKVMDAFFGAISSFLTKIDTLVKDLPENFTQTAAQIATDIATMFNSFKSATEAANGIKEPDQKIIEALQNLVNYILGTFASATSGMVTSWSSAMNSMAMAAEDFARRAIAAFNSIPYPGGTGNGSNPLGQSGGHGSGGGNPPMKSSFITPVGGWSTQNHYYNPIFVEGAEITDPDLHRLLHRQVAHKQSRNRGIKIGT